ncbi:hypothetical protein MAE02_70030 [Microvirga aerophila]|uniref:Uncharacterized protein n=1 Tax=Microvirga aerophila TaxID=670291 RepID=A0A512C5H6_9HYPH|nr:hypothetical protein MAE02_70030 [Microvirga aerophila]
MLQKSRVLHPDLQIHPDGTKNLDVGGDVLATKLREYGKAAGQPDNRTIARLPKQSPRCLIAAQNSVSLHLPF